MIRLFLVGELLASDELLVKLVGPLPVDPVVWPFPALGLHRLGGPVMVCLFFGGQLLAPDELLVKLFGPVPVDPIVCLLPGPGLDRLGGPVMVRLLLGRQLLAPDEPFVKLFGPIPVDLVAGLGMQQAQARGCRLPRPSIVGRSAGTLYVSLLAAGTDENWLLPYSWESMKARGGCVWDTQNRGALARPHSSALRKEGKNRGFRGSARILRMCAPIEDCRGQSHHGRPSSNSWATGLRDLRARSRISWATPTALGLQVASIPARYRNMLRVL